jgi:hypothetical protein
MKKLSLASGRVTPSDTIVVELYQPADSPRFVLVVWPAAPSVTSTDPRGLASVASAIAHVLAAAQTRLATIRKER